jgi:hypothetical protein
VRRMTRKSNGSASATVGGQVMPNVPLAALLSFLKEIKRLRDLEPTRSCHYPQIESG